MSLSVNFTLPGPGANLSPPNNSAPATQSRVPRPPNQWIVFLREFNRQYAQGPYRDHALSGCDRAKLASKIWRTYSADQKVPWEELAKNEAERHSEMFPGYTYQPRTHEERDLEKKSRGRKRKGAEVMQAIPQSQERTFPVTRSPRNHGARYNPYPVPIRSTPVAQPLQFSSSQFPYGNPGVFSMPQSDPYQPPRQFNFPATSNTYLAPPSSAHYMVRPQYQMPVASSSGSFSLPPGKDNDLSTVSDVEALGRFSEGSTNDTVLERQSNSDMWKYIKFDA